MNEDSVQPREVVITAMGLICALGSTPEEIIAAFKSGHTTFVRPNFDGDVVTAPVTGFDLRDFTGPCKERRYLNRGAQFSVAAAVSARQTSGLDAETAARAGLFVGSGPNLDVGGEFRRIGEGVIDEEDLMALWILRFLPNTAASTISLLTGTHGENLTVATACTATLQAIGEAFRKIKEGHLDLAFAGGGDARMNRGSILAYKKAKALFMGEGDPAQASRPFDNDRNGFVPGEGGAFFLLEEQEHAQRRGAKIYGKVRGFGTSLDGYSLTAPDPTGRWQEAAVQAALKEAGLIPAEIDLVAAHGTGTILNDAMEAKLLARIYGGQTPPVVALKSWIGHLSVACGAVELALCLIMMQKGYLPEIRNLINPCQTGVNFVVQGQAASPGTMLLENFGFGGQNCALIVQAQAG
jgi:3-oxoacyl-[acyl-carrier-protein] synthase II